MVTGLALRVLWGMASTIRISNRDWHLLAVDYRYALELSQRLALSHGSRTVGRTEPRRADLLGTNSDVGEYSRTGSGRDLGT